MKVQRPAGEQFLSFIYTQPMFNTNYKYHIVRSDFPESGSMKIQIQGISLTDFYTPLEILDYIESAYLKNAYIRFS